MKNENEKTTKVVVVPEGQRSVDTAYKNLAKLKKVFWFFQIFFVSWSCEVEKDT